MIRNLQKSVSRTNKSAAPAARSLRGSGHVTVAHRSTASSGSMISSRMFSQKATVATRPQAAYKRHELARTACTLPRQHSVLQTQKIHNQIIIKNNNNNINIKNNNNTNTQIMMYSTRPVLHSSQTLFNNRGLHTASHRLRTGRSTSHLLRSMDISRAAQQQSRSFADLPDHQLCPLPALSPTMETGTLVEWLKKEGDEIKAGDAIASVQTDKSVMDWQATEDGFLAKILVAGGTENIPVGAQPLCVIVESKSSVGAFANFEAPSSSSSSTAASSSSAPPPQPKQEEKQQAAPQKQAEQSAPAQTEIPSGVAGSPPPAAAFPKNRLLASPLAKSIASQLGVDLSKVSGSGPNGRIIATDLKNATVGATPKTAATSAAASAAPASGASYEDIPNSNIRKTTARRLTESKQTIPHYYLTMECRVDELMKTREYINSKANGKYKISVNDFVLKAAALALRDVPACNSHWMDSFIRK